MPNAQRDNNFVPTKLGVSNTDGITANTIWANPITHRMLIRTASTVPVGTIDAPRDGNRQTAVMGVSSTDGRKTVPIYVGSVTHSMYTETTI